MLTKEEKNVIIQKYGKNAKDTGSTQVQVAIYTKRIQELTAHLKKNKGDATAKRSLTELVGKRHSLLTYLEANDHDAYVALIQSLELRK